MRRYGLLPILRGAGADYLDDITDSLASDGDRGIVYHLDGTVGYYLEYVFDADSAVAESLPFVLQPDSGSGRWLLSAESYHSITFTVENPTSSENIGGVRFDCKAKIYKIIGVLRGSSTPSVTIQPQHGTDRTSGTNLFSSAQAVTSTTTGDVDISGFNDATIAADAFLWLTTTSQSGTVNEIDVTIIYVKYWGS